MIRKIILLLVLCLSGTLYAQDWQGSFTTAFKRATIPYDKYNRYKGDHRYCKRNGLGIYKWERGSVYFGDWIKDKQEGFGIYMEVDGYHVTNCPGCVYFSGNWVNGKKSGKGSCYNAAGELIYYGDFIEDYPAERYPSTGDLSDYKFRYAKFDNGDKYIGETKKGIKFGYGAYIWADGDIWFGYFDNTRLQGLWIEGNGALWQKQRYKDGKKTQMLTSAVAGTSPLSMDVEAVRKEAETCNGCQGKGEISCYACEGKGTRTETISNVPNQRAFHRQVTCNVCRKSGQEKCMGCSGKGKVYAQTLGVPDYFLERQDYMTRYKNEESNRPKRQPTPRRPQR